MSSPALKKFLEDHNHAPFTLDDVADLALSVPELKDAAWAFRNAQAEFERKLESVGYVFG